MRDFLPITLVARVPAMLATHPSVPANNLKEFVAHVRQQAEPVHHASAGAGTFPHLTGVLFEQMEGIKLLTVHYKGGAEAAVTRAFWRCTTLGFPRHVTSRTVGFFSQPTSK